MQQIQAKVERIRQSIEQQTQKDPAFKYLFVQQLVPMLQNSLSTQEFSKRKRDLTDPKGFVYDMPRVDVDYDDPQVGEPLTLLDSDRLDKEVNRIYKEYQRQKEAYRKAIVVHEFNR